MNTIPRSLTAWSLAVAIYGVASSTAGEPAIDSTHEAATSQTPSALFLLGSTKFRGNAKLGALAFSPDGSFLVASDGEDGLCVWAVPSGRVIRHVKLAYPQVQKLWFSTERAELHCVLWTLPFPQTEHYRWSLPGWKPLPNLPAGEATPVPINYPEPDNKRRVAVDPDNAVSVTDLASDAEILRVPARKWHVFPELFEGAGLLLIASSDAEGEQSRLEVWDLATGKKLHEWNTGKEVLSRFAFTPGNSMLVAAAGRSDIYCWDLKSGKELARIPNRDFFIWPLFPISSDGRHFVAAHEGAVDLFELSSGRKIHTFAIGGFPGDSVFSADGRFVAVGSGGVARVFDMRSGKELANTSGHEGTIADIAFVRDARRLVTLDAVNSSDDLHHAISWDLNERRPMHRMELHGTGMALSMSADGLFCIAEPRTNVPLVWDIERDRLLPESGQRQPGPFAITASRNGKLFLAHDDGSISEEWGSSWRGHVGKVLALAASDDGSTVVSLGSDQTLRVWKPGSPNEVVRVDLPGQPAACIALSGDASRIAAAAGHRLFVWKGSGGAPITSIDCDNGGPTVLRFAPNAKTIAVGTTAGQLSVFDAATGKSLQQQKAHQGGVSALEFSPDGSRIYSGGQDGAIRQWDPGNLGAGVVVDERLAPILSLVWIAEGSRLAASDTAHLVAIYDPAKQKQLRAFHSYQPTVLMSVQDRSPQAGPNPRGAIAEADSHPFWLRMADAMGRVENRNVSTYEWGGTYDIARQSEFPAAISPNGKLIAKATPAAVRLWEVATGATWHDFVTNVVLDKAIAFSHSGNLLAAGGRGWCLWRLDTRTPSFAVPASRSGDITELRFSPDDRQLITRGEREHVKLWDTITGELDHELRLPDWFSLRNAAITSDGRLLIAVAADPRGDMEKSAGPRAALWEFATGKRLTDVRLPGVACTRIVLSADDRRLALGQANGMVLICDGKQWLDKLYSRFSAGDSTPLEQLWDDLGDADPNVAYGAIGRMCLRADAAVALIKAKLPVLCVEPLSEPAIGRLIEELGSEDAAVCREASSRLLRLKPSANSTIRAALRDHPAVEVQARLELLLAAPAPLSSARLRGVRAVQTLERIATPAARELLKSMAAGPARSELTHEARSASERLDAKGPSHTTADH